jgi:hypothetical protein
MVNTLEKPQGRNRNGLGSALGECAVLSEERRTSETY